MTHQCASQLNLKKNLNPAFIVTFGDCSEISPNFISKFLSNVTNITNLSKYLANKFLASHEGKQSVLHVAFGDSIISNSEAVLSETDINQCNSEETNPRIARHVTNLEKKGYTNVQVKLVDSDIFFLFLTYVEVAILNRIEDFLVVHVPKEKRIDIINNFDKFGANVCKDLEFFHASAGCDVSNF